MPRTIIFRARVTSRSIRWILNSPPIGTMESIPDVIEALKQKARQTPAGQWITGRGYDDTLLREGRHPTRGDLDRASTQHPIWIAHTS